jgi:hypothetical protein
VVAAAAYRLGARMEDHEYGELRDFTRRSGVVTSFTLTPAHAPDWAHNPERLWNAAEAAENRRNSQLARECELALPALLTDGQREALVRMFAMDLVERYGVAITAAIHAPSRHGDQKNYHAHILMTTRRMTEDGLGEKTRVLDAKATGPKEIAWIREHVCDLINSQLLLAGIDEQVDHRSFKARGIDREPTTHLGPTATDIERRGGESDRGNANRDTEERNRELDALVEEYAALDIEITAEEERRLDERFGLAEDEPPQIGADIVPAQDAPRQRQAKDTEAATEEARPSQAITAGEDGRDGRSPAHAKSNARDASFRSSMRPAIASVKQTGETTAGARRFAEMRESADRIVTAITRVRDGILAAFGSLRGAWRSYLDGRQQNQAERDPSDHSR